MNSKVKYRYNSLEDFLIFKPLSVDGQLDDGWGAIFSVKGCEIKATILFVDITSFSKRTFGLSPTETLIFVNNFFTWITAEAFAEALIVGSGIIDKYIGDEIMIIFSEEFGSQDSFVDALQTAKLMADNDALDFCPHMGIANGLVTVGFVGTPLKYNCSVFGMPVVLAKRCASVTPQTLTFPSIIFPAELWKNYSFEEIFHSQEYKKPDGMIQKLPLTWELLPARKVQMKNIPDTEILEVAKKTKFMPSLSAEERAKEALLSFQKTGKYKPANIKGK